MFNEVDLKSLWKDLDEYTAELDNESRTFQEVWQNITAIKEKTDIELKGILSKDEFTFLSPETLIGFNVGGQLFEIEVEYLIKDPFSILASCCRSKFKSLKLLPQKNGYFYINRDWWLFRHIINYLKTNKLPTELEILRELYIEASYYKLESLQKSIESLPCDQVKISGSSVI